MNSEFPEIQTNESKSQSRPSLLMHAPRLVVLQDFCMKPGITSNVSVYGRFFGHVPLPLDVEIEVNTLNILFMTSQNK